MIEDHLLSEVSSYVGAQLLLDYTLKSLEHVLDSGYPLRSTSYAA